MKTWEVVILSILLFTFGCMCILSIADIKEKVRRKQHPRWYEHYDRALSNSLAVGSRFREQTKTLNKRREMIQEMFFHDECTEDEFNEAMKTLDKEHREAAKQFSINKEALGIIQDLEEADAYAKEHNLKWGIIYD